MYYISKIDEQKTIRFTSGEKLELSLSDISLLSKIDPAWNTGEAKVQKSLTPGLCGYRFDQQTATLIAHDGTEYMISREALTRLVETIVTGNWLPKVAPCKDCGNGNMLPPPNKPLNKP